MRIIAASLLALFLLAPVTASAGPLQECRYLNQRIEFFSARLEHASEMGDDRWVERFGGHLAELVNRRAAICPGYGPGEQAQAAFAELLKLGGQAALTFFTLGML